MKIYAYCHWRDKLYNIYFLERHKETGQLGWKFCNCVLFQYIPEGTIHLDGLVKRVDLMKEDPFEVLREFKGDDLCSK